MPVSELKFAPYNPRKITKKEKEKLKRSIEEFGYIEPIVWNKHTGHVVGGNQRLTVLKEMGVQEVEVVVVELDLEKEKVLNLALNKISGDWDYEKLQEILANLDSFMQELAGFDLNEVQKILGEWDDSPYTFKLPKVQYEPAGIPVELKDLVDISKYEELLEEIEKSSVSEEEKKFLRLAATRFIKFDFDYIAEYYCAKASPEMQRLFEKLALVIVDFNDAIQHGFVEMSKKLYKILKNTKSENIPEEGGYDNEG